MSSGTHSFRRAAIVVAILGSAASCTPDSNPSITDVPQAAPVANAGGIPNSQATAGLAAVMAGNAQAVAAAPGLVPPGAPLTPFVEARLYAIANIAMHDALNAIVPRFERYADDGPIVREAGIAAAVLTAARDAIVGADPAAQTETDAWYATEIAPFQGTVGFAEGVSLGQRTALAILNMRASDGTAGGAVAPYSPGTNPGDYQFTFPFNTPGFDFFGTGGFADASRWGTIVTPFSIPSGADFRAPRPYGAASNALAVLTPRYTADYNEIKELGCANCTARNAEQTEIALWWAENSPTGFNRIGRKLAEQRNLDAWDTGRLLAVLAIGEFDSYVASFDSKYYYNFWRPVTAVALADNDGNPNTSSVGGWEVLLFPTPPVPDYPSAHSSAGGAAAAIIEGLLPGRGRSFSVTSTSLPGVTRTFATIDQAARENALSRVLIGYHFRLATEAGLAQGREVGAYVVQHSLRPIRP